MAIEEVIFSHLLYNEEYCRKVMPFLKTEYFQSRTNKIIFELFENYVKTYHKVPTKEVIISNIENINNITSEEYQTCTEQIPS